LTFISFCHYVRRQIVTDRITKWDYTGASIKLLHWL